VAAPKRTGGHVDQQLVPHGAEDVVADLGGEACVVEGGGDALHARAQRAVEFADDGFLALGARQDVARREHHAAGVGLAGQHVFAAHHLGQDVFVAEAVLQRQHGRVGPDDAAGRFHHRAGVERLHQHDHQIDHADRAGVGGRMHRHLAVHAGFAHDQAVLPHRIHMGAAAVHQPDLVAVFGQHAADGTTQGAGAQYTNLQIRLRCDAAMASGGGS
jgi:hypothetical protein